MRLLILATNFHGWVCDTIYYEQSAILEALPRSVIYGPGYKYEANNVQCIIEEFGGESSFDAILCYASEGSLKGEPLAQPIMDRYNITNDLSKFPLNLKNVNLPKILWINDFWHCTQSEWNNIIFQNGIDVILSTYVPPFVPISIFRKYFSDDILKKVPLIPWPRSINPHIFKDYQLHKSIDISLFGAMGEFYPLRKKMHEVFSRSRDIIFFTKDHPGYTFHSNSFSLVGEHYAKILNRSRIVASCSTRFMLPIIKTYEAAACKSVLLSDTPSGMEHLGFISGVNYISVNADNFLYEAKKMLKNDEVLSDMQQAAYDLVHTRHVPHIRAKEFVEIFEAFLDNAGPKSWAKLSCNYRTVKDSFAISCLENKSDYCDVESLGKAYPTRIAMLYDMKGWAWWHRAHNVSRYIGDGFQIDVLSRDKFFSPDDYRFIVMFESRELERLPPLPQSKLVLGCSNPRFFDSAFSTYLKGEFAGFILNNLAMYNAAQFAPNIFYCPNGVDEELFFPSPTEPKEFTACWTGNSSAVAEKGLDIIKAACVQANVPLLFHDRQASQRLLSHEELRDTLYHKASVYINASMFEGTPNPALEAMACGLAVVSTRTGNMPELIENGKNGFLVEREPKFIAQALLALKKESREKIVKFSRKSILDGWTWELQAKRYRQMFEELL